jgi:hypothetical protein
VSGAGGRSASVVDDVWGVCGRAVARRLEYHGCGGVASRVSVVTGGGMESGCSALQERGWTHVMGCRAFCEVSEPPEWWGSIYW